MEGANSAPKPRDARTVEAILKSMGVGSYDPRVVNQLLELLYRYVSSVLTDSREFSEHADKPAIDLDDTRLAIRSKCSFTFTQPPPRDVTMRLAAERNVVPLPPVDQGAGVALPPQDQQLTAQNYHVVIAGKRTPEKTQHSSPKRPRLVSSPFKPPNSTPVKTTAERSPSSSKIAIPRSSQSPKRMNVDSPLKQKSPHGSKSPKGQNTLPPTAVAGLQQIGDSSVVKARAALSSATVVKQVAGQPIGSGTSVKPGTAVPDVTMVDAGSNRADATAGVLSPNKSAVAGTGRPSSVISPKQTNTPPRASVPK